MLQDDVAVNTMHTSGRIFPTGRMQVPRKSRDNSASIYRDWLRRLPDMTGQSYTAIANELKIAVSTLTRPLREDDPGISTPRQSTIDKIVERYDVPPPQFAPGSIVGRIPRGITEDARPYEPVGEAEGEAIRLMMRGAGGNIAPWIVRSRALELAGYLPGDVVMVDIGKQPKPGDVVCAQVNIDQRGTTDTIMRIFERAGAAHILVTASVDPTLRVPLAVDDRVAILGVVVGMIRPIRHAA